MTKEAHPKTIKDQIRWPLWSAIAVNLAVLYGFSHYEAVTSLGIKGLIASMTSVLPMCLGLGVTTVANGLLSADAKARLVFLRREHALPGHRAFSTFAVADPRIDDDGLRKLLGKSWPTDPLAENRAWYKLFTEIENDPPILHFHREFLFSRDYAGLAAIFLLAFGSTAAVTIRPASVLAVYLAFLILQFWLARHAAMTYGNRLVCTVLARKAAAKVEPKAGRKRAVKPQAA